MLLCAPRAGLAYDLLHVEEFCECAGVEQEPDDEQDVSEAVLVELEDEKPGDEVADDGVVVVVHDAAEHGQADAGLGVFQIFVFQG